MVVDRALSEGAFAGIDFLAAAFARSPAIPTALMTGDLTDETLVMAGRAGARVIAEKPVSPSAIVRALEGEGATIRLLRSGAAPIVRWSARTDDLRLATMNRALARRVLAHFGGNKSLTATALGISRPYLDKLLSASKDDGSDGG